MMATRMPAPARRCAREGPDCPVPMMIASNAFILSLLALLVCGLESEPLVRVVWQFPDPTWCELSQILPGRGDSGERSSRHALTSVPPALAMREKLNLGAPSKRGKGCRLAKAASTLFVVGLQKRAGGRRA